MKTTTERILYSTIKIIVHLSVISISTLLTINLFVNFSEVPLYKALYVVVALAIELGKIYVFLLAKAHFKLGYRFFPTLLFIVYLGLALVSLVSNTGFSLTTIEQQSKTIEIQNSVSDNLLLDRELKQLTIDVEFLLEERTSNLNKKKELPSDWVVNRRELQSLIDNHTLLIETKNGRINEILLEKQTLSNTNSNLGVDSKSSDIFDLLGNKINMNGSTVMLIIMMTISLLIELLTIITSGTLHLKNVEPKKKGNIIIGTTPDNIKTIDSSVDMIATSEHIDEVEESINNEDIPSPNLAYTINKEEFTTYIKALFSEGKDRLLQDHVIAEKTGIKANHCRSYRRKLLEMSYNGEPLLESKRGVGTKSVYPVRTILKLVDKDTERKWK